MPSHTSQDNSPTDSTLDEPRPAASSLSAADSSDPIVNELRHRVDSLERKIGESKSSDSSSAPRPATANRATANRTVNMRSNRELYGYPVYHIAFGPDQERGTSKSHAKGIIAVGDHATGVIAIGGMAQGVIAIGGLSWGLFTVGGVTLGLAAGIGGVAIGGVVLGGVAIGLQAFGGLAISGLSELTGMFTSASPPTS